MHIELLRCSSVVTACRVAEAAEPDPLAFSPLASHYSSSTITTGATTPAEALSESSLGQYEAELSLGALDQTAAGMLFRHLGRLCLWFTG
jgi:hypothetical protein